MKVSILHEGKSIDKDFFKLLYKRLGITEEELDIRVNFIGMGNKSNFFKVDNKNYTLLQEELKSQRVEKVLFVLDSDYEGDKNHDGYHNTLREIQSIQKKLNIDDVSDTFIAYDMNSKTKEGYLESLILSTLSKKEKEYIESFLDCSDFKSKENHKAILNQIYKIAYPQAPFDFSHENFNELKQKLKNLFKEEK